MSNVETSAAAPTPWRRTPHPLPADSLAEQQDVLRRALAVLDAGPVWDPDVPDESREEADWALRNMLRSAFADHEMQLSPSTDHEPNGCPEVGGCFAVTAARRVLALAGRHYDIVRLRKVIVATVDAESRLPDGHVDDELADRIAAAVLVHQAGAR